MSQRSTGTSESSTRDGGVHCPFGLLPNGRNRFCLAATLYGERNGSPDGDAGLVGSAAIQARYPRKFVGVRCKCWDCSLCGPRKAAQYRSSILRAISRERLTRMLTLTLDPRNVTTEEESKTYFEHFATHKALGKACGCGTCARVQVRSIKHIRKCWAKLRVYLHRREGVAPKFIVVVEFQKVTGLAHLHIALDRYIGQKWIKETWLAVGGGQHVDIRRVDAHRAAAYMSKYLSKGMLLAAPKGIRRVSTSRSICLNKKKPSPYRWQLLKTPVNVLYVRHRTSAVEVVRNEDEVESFSLRE